jgi:peptidoglycan/xylan/chitin deacetylase (PgdA/CDA1 family)
VLAGHLELLGRDYQFVSIDWLLEGGESRRDDRPPLLITFDDAYASVASAAADICLEAGAPSIFFVNGSFVNNETLAFDNLVAWIVNTLGMSPIVVATGREFADLKEFFGPYLASLSLNDRKLLYDRLVDAMSVDPARMAAEASLYVSSRDLVTVRDKGMVVGNHTWSHVHCRSLDSAGVESEILSNQRFLESTVDRRVEAFSYPYGSGADATDSITSTLVDSRHKAAFLVDSRMNRPDPEMMRLFRVSAGLVDTADLFADIEVFPVMRSVRDRLRRHHP